jgi:pimeloyl-ACP methyl ester carboxylesterase
VGSTVTTTDGVALHVTEQGEGAPVVLVAGFAAPATSWVFQVDALVDAGYRAICVDRRSHGRSESPAYGQRLSRHGADLHEVLRALDLTDVVLVGGSMGASAGWACLDLFGTERVRGVVAADQTPRMRNGADWSHGFYGLTDEGSGTFFDAGIPDTGRGAGLDQIRESFTRLASRLGPGADLGGAIRPETLPLLRDHAQQDWRDVVARLDVPQLLVAGRHSQFWPCEHAAAAVAGNPLGRAVVIEDAGHAVNLDQVEPFNAALLGFLSDL